MKTKQPFYLILLAGAISVSAPIACNAYVNVTIHNVATAAVQCAVTDQGWSDSGLFGPSVAPGGTAGPYGLFFIANGTGIFTATDSHGNPYTCSPSSFTADASGNGTLTLTVGGGGGGGGGTTSTNGCLTLNNNSSQPQYYHFQNTLLTPGGTIMSNIAGCGSGLSVNGVQGPAASGDPTSYMAIYPGESITVCFPLTAASGQTDIVSPLMAPTDGSVWPCGLSVGSPRCVSLCTGDNVPYAGASDSQGSAFVQYSPSGGPPTITNSAQTNANSFFGQADDLNQTNINFSGVPTNSDIPTLQLGFNGVVSAIQSANVNNQVGAEQIQASANSNTILWTNALKTDLAAFSNAFPTNFAGLSNLQYLTNSTNYPTNYPDAAAIALLGTIATNTAKSNAIDTNLDALAAAIASNTAAPLAYTNLNIGAYSTNPDTTVSYASNTLAAPVSQSMQGYAQSASTAANAVNVGGSPGGLLTITFDLPGVGTYTIDCNPMDNADVADFASWFRSVMEWIVGVGFVGLVLRDGTTATRTTLLTPQGQFPKLTILGNSIGWPLAAVYIVAIVAAMAAVPFAIVTWFSVGATGQMWWQQIVVNPFSGAGVGRAVGLSLWLADQFVPMSYIVSSALYYIAFRFTLNGIVTVAAIIVRALMA